jgi:hypothetical protein
MPIGLPKSVYRFRDFGKSLNKGVEWTDRVDTPRRFYGIFSPRAHAPRPIFKWVHPGGTPSTPRPRALDPPGHCTPHQVECWRSDRDRLRVSGKVRCANSTSSPPSCSSAPPISAFRNLSQTSHRRGGNPCDPDVYFGFFTFWGASRPFFPLSINSRGRTDAGTLREARVWGWEGVLMCIRAESSPQLSSSFQEKNTFWV